MREVWDMGDHVEVDVELPDEDDESPPPDETVPIAAEHVIDAAVDAGVAARTASGEAAGAAVAADNAAESAAVAVAAVDAATVREDRLAEIAASLERTAALLAAAGTAKVEESTGPPALPEPGIDNEPPPPAPHWLEKKWTLRRGKR